MLRKIQCLMIWITISLCKNDKIFYGNFTNYIGSFNIHFKISGATSEKTITVSLYKNYTLTSAYSNIDIKDEECIDFVRSKRTNKIIKASNQNKMIEIFNHIIPTFSLHISPYDENLEYEESLGLAFKFENESYSLLHQLKLNNEIDKMQFGFIFNINEKRNIGKMFFGGIPKELISQKYFAKCFIDTNYHSWGCNLQKVIVNNHQYINTIYSYFNTESRNTLIPYSFYAFLGRYLISDHLFTLLCKVRNYSNEYHYYCANEVIDEFPQISFIISNYVFTFKVKELSDCSLSGCSILLKHNIDYNYKWIFGTYFLNRYDLLFDYDDHSITFIYDYPFPSFSSNITIICFMIICNVVLCLNIILLIITKVVFYFK